MNTRRLSEITLAVLPFQVLSDQDVINPNAFGFTDDLISNFSRFNGLSVISKLSTQHIRDTADVEAISRLGADYVVAGTFRTRADRLRIGVQLIRCPDFAVVFAHQYDETLDAVFETQDEIVQQIVGTLQQHIDHDILSYSYKKQDAQPAAYEHWLIGMHYLKKGALESDLEARNHFEAALQIDPSFARAYTGISLSYFNEWSCQLWDRWEVSKQGAHQYALKALEHDGNDYVSLAVLGRTWLYAGEYEKAEACSRKSLQMNPNDVQNLVRVAFSMMFLGHAAESVELYLRACRLNPLHQDAYFAYGSSFYLEAGDFARAVELGKKVDLDSIWVDFPMNMAAAYYHLGDMHKAREYWYLYVEQFKKHIIKGKEPDPGEALNWHMDVNPFKEGKTLLRPFWDYVREAGLSEQPARPSHAESPLTAAFVHRGDMWEITYQGQRITLKDAKGLHDIAKLLAEPEKEIFCAELAGAVLVQEGIEMAWDEKAKKAYQQKLTELQAGIREAEMMSDSAQTAALSEEYDRLIDHLSASLGLDGKPRNTGSSVEKARMAVTWRIRNAIKKMNKAHPELARHLTRTVKTGTWCAYIPERKIHWMV